GEYPFTPITSFLPDLTPEVLAENRHWLQPAALDANDFLVLCIQSYVLRTPNHTILVDTCVGNDKPRPTRPIWDMKTDDTWMRALAAAGLDADAGRIAGTLSHGAKRQLEIAMCLATAPRALLLDEPLAGMGAEETGRMLDLLVGLKAGHAVLLVEHDMDAVFRVADRITVMVNGQVIASDVPDRIRNDRAVQLAYLGDGAPTLAADAAALPREGARPGLGPPGAPRRH
ncbi:MAG: ATP-binding cassette domain-containing protein, partial [Caldimonas sp.]